MYSQEDYPDSIVQRYFGSVKVLSNSSMSYGGEGGGGMAKLNAVDGLWF
jgi:hypothetical protein